VIGDEDGTAARLWSMANLGTPMALRVAATLRLADHIAAGRTTAAALAEAVDANPDALERLLRYLSVRGVLNRDDSGSYSLTALGQPLRSEHPAGVRHWFDIDGAGRGELSFVELLHSVRTGDAAFPVRYGAAFWDDLAADPDRAAAFNKALGDDVVERSPHIVTGYDWASVGHIVDVGGGDGSLLISLLRANPGLRGTVVDLPEAVQKAKESFAAAGIDDRADAVAGSFFEPLPPGAGGYSLSLILHDWNDEDATAILSRCAEAAGDTGTVFILETIGAEGSTPHTGMDLRMLCIYGAKERGVADFAVLAGNAGLRVAGVHQAGPTVIIELKAA